jgi:hypothetical protein
MPVTRDLDAAFGSDKRREVSVHTWRRRLLRSGHRQKRPCGKAADTIAGQCRLPWSERIVGRMSLATLGRRMDTILRREAATG